jgi:hypothetical protein
VPHLNLENLDELEKSKSWEVEASSKIPSPTKKVVILNKSANRNINETLNTIAKPAPNTTPQKFFIQSNRSLSSTPKRKANIVKIETFPKRMRIEDDFRISDDIYQPQQDEIDQLSNTVEISEPLKPIREVQRQVSEEVAEPSQNKLLALFDVTVDQYAKLREALDSGQNIISVMNTIDNVIESNVETAADDCKLQFTFSSSSLKKYFFQRT